MAQKQPNLSRKIIPMKVAAVSYRVPSRVMTNSDMIATLDELNPDVSRLRKTVFFQQSTPYTADWAQKHAMCAT